MPRRSKRLIPDANVPKFTIDLSLTPRERYKALATSYKSKFQDLIPLFDGLLADLGIAQKYHPSINRLAGVMLRGVHSRVETEELKGISDVSGISMYLLVAFNVVLDLLMGCTSGAVKSTRADQSMNQWGMLHFRTLDWSMDPLRNFVVHLDFIRSKSSTPETIVASSVTYVGFSTTRRHVANKFVSTFIICLYCWAFVHLSQAFCDLICLASRTVTTSRI